MALIRKLSNCNTNSTVTNEITKFSHVTEEIDDILMWWRHNVCNYPVMANLAKIILATPATSAPAERIFSLAGDIVTKKRSNLSSFKLNYIIFIHENYNLIA